MITIISKAKSSVEYPWEESLRIDIEEDANCMECLTAFIKALKLETYSDYTIYNAINHTAEKLEEQLKNNKKSLETLGF